MNNMDKSEQFQQKSTNSFYSQNIQDQLQDSQIGFGSNYFPKDMQNLMENEQNLDDQPNLERKSSNAYPISLRSEVYLIIYKPRYSDIINKNSFIYKQQQQQEQKQDQPMNGTSTINFDSESELVYCKLQQMILFNQLQIEENVKLIVNNKSSIIVLAGPDNLVQATQNMIIETKQELINKLIKRTLKLNNEQMKIFKKKVSSNQYQNTYECEIQINQENDKWLLIVECFDLSVVDKIQNDIETILSAEIKIHLGDGQELELLYQGCKYIKQGCNMFLQIFASQLSSMIAEIPQYPKNWTQVEENCKKVDLPKESEEYKEIESEYKRTDQGQIFKIYRLQNKKLWDSYQKQLEIWRGRESSKILVESERYLWYGFKNIHPRRIYERSEKAFQLDNNEVNQFMQDQQNQLKQGSYFTERADYSRGNYSYKLTEEDDPVHAGKLVLLCCKVMPGKIYKHVPDQTIQHTSVCDCEFRSEDRIFVLYGDDEIKAYPAYEIIYE